MSIFVKKKQFLAATLIIALGAAVTVNWFYNSKNSSNGSVNDYTDYSQSGKLGDSILVAGTVEYTENETEISEEKENSAYFSQAKLKRSEANDEILDLIDELNDSLIFFMSKHDAIVHIVV